MPSPPSPVAEAPAERRRIPVAVYVLGLSVFALGTSEFMLAGVLPPLADDLNVSIPTAGLLISAFAVGMVVGAPVLAAATQPLPRRTALVGLLAVFCLGQVVGAVSPTYALLFVTRVISALASAGFWAVATAAVVAMVRPTVRARALSILIGGLSLANVAGVPGGALLGQHFGWRSSFWAVTALSVLGLIGVLTLVPRTEPAGAADRPRIRTELRVYRDGQVWLVIVTTALFAASTFCLFSYLAPLLTDVSGLKESWVPVVLVLYGVGAFTGTLVGGRTADARPFGTLYVGLSASTVVLVLIGFTASVPAVTVVLSTLLGFTAFLVSPALNARVFAVANDAPTLAGATTAFSFNVGNTVGPWVGGLVISAGLGYDRTAWAGAVLCAAAVGTTALQVRAAGRRSRTVAQASGAAEPNAVCVSRT